MCTTQLVLPGEQRGTGCVDMTCLRRDLHLPKDGSKLVQAQVKDLKADNNAPSETGNTCEGR